MLSRCNGVPDGDGRHRVLREGTERATAGASHGDGKSKHHDAALMGMLVDNVVVEKGSIKIEENRAKDPAMQRALEERDAQRWADTLLRAGVRQR